MKPNFVPAPSATSIRPASSARRNAHPLALAAVLSLSGMIGMGRATLAADDLGKTPPPATGAPASATPAVAATPAPAGKILLRNKAQAGQAERVRGTAIVTATGGKASVLQIDRVVFTKVDATSGDLTIEDTTEKSDTTTEAGTQAQDKPTVSSYTIHPNGMLVSFKSAAADKEGAAIDARLHQASSIIFSDKPVGVGDKWIQDYKANATFGTREGHAVFEVVSAPTIAGAPAMKIKMTYSETGENPISSKGVALVETATGDEMASDAEINGFPLEGTTALASFHSERYEGGPVANTKNDVTAAVAAIAEPKKDKSIDDVVKEGFEKIPGIVTLYRKQENGGDTIYAEVREDQIGQLMMLQATASTGTGTQVAEGDPIDDLVFKFTKTPDDRLVLTVPNFKFRADADTPMAKSLHRSFTDAFLQTFRIEAKSPERKSVLINLSEFFKGDIAQVSSLFSGGGMGFGGMGGGGGFGMDRDKTFVSTVKNFPDNLTVSTQYSFMHMGRGGDDAVLADSRNVSVLVTYNLFALPVDANFQPTNGYRPRLADSRVGYFTGGIDGVGPNYFDFNDDSKADNAVYFIQRWDLRKKDTNAALSEPVRPIVFWIDNAVPYAYRDAVRAGLLTWNKAFEKVGFKNAIVVNQMPDKPDPKDPNVPTDTADMRFNTIRWITSPTVSFAAIALARANPLTGQVLNASISIDSDAIRLEKAFDQRVLVTPAQTFNTASGVDAEEAVVKSKLAALAAGTGGRDAFAGPFSNTARLDSRYCTLGNGLKEQAWYGNLALAMMSPSGVLTPTEKKTYIDQYIQEMVAHEMGHIMGLRHNFAASTQYSLADLESPKVTNEGGLGGSVMDYNPFNIMALHKAGVPYFSQTIGTYDYWAIKYGYTDIPSAHDTKGELPVLRQIASQSGMPGHAYASDEMANQFDPNVTAFDLSSDPVGYWHRTMDLSRYLLLNLDKHEPKAGESFWEFTRSFEILLNVYAGGAGEASRYIGGLNTSRSYKGDPQSRPTLQPIDVAKQREALALLNDYVFSPSALTFPKRYYTELTTDPFTMDAGDFPIQDNIGRLQKNALNRLFSGSVLSRVANNEFKMGGDPTKALTLANLFTSVSGNVWAEVDQHKNVPTMRRQLQRAYVDTMVDMVTGKSGGAPEDACMLAWDQLHGLKTRLETAQKSPSASGYDTYTRVHLAESLVKVNRALNAGIMLNSGSGGGGMSLMQLLMSGQKANGSSAQ